MNIKFDHPNKTRTDFLEELIRSLAKRRYDLRMTQEELNYKLGMSDCMLNKWEAGHRSPTAFHLYCWADALHGKIIFQANYDPAESNAIKLSPPANDNRLIGVPANDNLIVPLPKKKVA